MSPARKVDAFLGSKHVVTSSTAPKTGTAGAGLPAAKPKPARVTLNLPPDLYRQLVRWTHAAEESTGVPRVGVQEAMRAMIRVITSDEAPSCSARVMAELRVEAER